MLPQGSGIYHTSDKTREDRKEHVEVGASRSSVEASNDRGAKGWQSVRA